MVAPDISETDTVELKQPARVDAKATTIAG